MYSVQKNFKVRKKSKLFSSSCRSHDSMLRFREEFSEDVGRCNLFPNNQESVAEDSRTPFVAIPSSRFMKSFFLVAIAENR